MELAEYHPFRSAQAKAEYLALNAELAQDWPVAAEGRMIDTAYGQTFVRISGRVDGPPLVLLPGANLCSLMWLPNIAPLSRNYRTYAVDTLINTGSVGRSVYTQAITNSKEAVKWLDELFTSLGIGDKINIVGMSYGGWLTSHYALHFPERLNRMVLLAPALLPMGWEFILHAIPPLLVPTRNSYRRFFDWLLNDLAQADPRRLAMYVNLMVTSRQCLETAKYALPSPLKDEELQSIQVPTLLLVGEDDRSYSVKKAVQKLSQVAPQWRTEIIPDVGHSLTLVLAELVNQKILEFLASRDGRRKAPNPA